MPYNFSGFLQSNVAKLGVVSDGEVFTVSATDGYTITSTLSSRTAFVANPTRSGTGVYAITLKDPTVKLLDVEVRTLTSSGAYLSAQVNLPTVDSQYRTVINFTFNNAGTPANFATGGDAQKFLVYVVYSDSSGN